MSKDREEALKLVNITKTYQMGEQTIEVLKNVNLTVKRGELLVVMGPSGSGKSTLLNIAGTLDRPTSGKVYIGGVDVTGMSEEELSIFRCRHIGFVFQSYNLLRNFTARENVMIPMLISGIYNVEEARERAETLLSIVGLEEHAEKFPSQLSGGQQQRVAIARALANDPDVILMDEPTGNLDVRSASNVAALIVWLNRVFGQTFIVVTHNPELAKISTRTIYIAGGRLYSEPPSGLLSVKIGNEVDSLRLRNAQIRLLQVKAKSLLRLIKSGAATPQIEREVEEIEKRIADITKLIEKGSR